MSNKAKVLKHIQRAVCSRSAFGDHYVIRNKDGYGYFGRGKTPALAWANAASWVALKQYGTKKMTNDLIEAAVDALSKPATKISAEPVAWRVRWANGEVELTEDAERVEEYRIAKEQFAQLTITPLAALTQIEAAVDALAELKLALEKIVRTPSRPFPDAGAHSWEAFGRAVYSAWVDVQNTARAALNATNALATTEPDHD